MLGKRLLLWIRKSARVVDTLASSLSRRLCSKGCGVAISVRMRDALHGGDENLAVADFACLRSFSDRVHHGVDVAVVDHHFDLQFLQKLNV